MQLISNYAPIAGSCTAQSDTFHSEEIVRIKYIGFANFYDAQQLDDVRG